MRRLIGEPRDWARTPPAWAMVAVVLAVVAGVAAWLARPAQAGRAPAGVRVAGVAVGGLSAAQVRRVAEMRAPRLAAGRAVRLDGPGAIDVSVPAADLGARADAAAAVRAALAPRPWTERLLARADLGAMRDVPLALRADPSRARALAASIAAGIDAPPADAGVLRRADEFIVRPARAGRRVDRAELARRLAALPARVAVPVAAVPPAVGTMAAVRARHVARVLSGRPPVVAGLGRRVRLRPVDVLAAIRFTPRGGRIAVTLAPGPLARRLRPGFRPVERAARSAAFRVRGDRVVVVPGRNGRRLDVGAVARAIVARPGPRVVAAAFAGRRPARTTAQARAMGIRRVVGEFTTPYGCCQPRVTNIRRAAQILNGTVIPAGGTFSLNRALGRRTAARGFVSAPWIVDGRLVEGTGGGVSQIATTVFNAAFFSGLELVQHTPHQFWISRYPMGREATVSWGGPELVVRNDWPAAVLMTVQARATSVTVRMYSSPLGRRVTTTTSRPRDVRPARTRVVRDPRLRPGQRVQVQAAGGEGFRVLVTRRVYRGARLLRDERYGWRYDPEDAIVHVGR